MCKQTPDREVIPLSVKKTLLLAVSAAALLLTGCMAHAVTDKEALMGVVVKTPPKFSAVALAAEPVEAEEESLPSLELDWSVDDAGLLNLTWTNDGSASYTVTRMARDGVREVAEIRGGLTYSEVLPEKTENTSIPSPGTPPTRSPFQTA